MEICSNLSFTSPATHLRRENLRLRTCVAELRAEVASLRTELATCRQDLACRDLQVADLKKQLTEAERQSHGAKLPFGRKRPKKKPKRPGRKAGHKPAWRPPPEHVDRILDAPFPPECPGCGAEIHGMEDLVEVLIHHQYQTEVPRVKPTVTQINVPCGRCCRCGRRVQGRHPEQTSDALGAAASQLGPLALGLAAEMKVRLGISFGKIVDFFHVVFGVQVSRGGLALSLPRLALAHGEDVRGILDLVRQAPSVNSDATSWWIGSKRATLAVFATESVSLYVIGQHFTHEVVEVVLGPEFAGVLGSDCGSVYDPIDAWKQKCLGHIIKDLAELSHQKIGEHLAFPLEALVVLRTAIALKGRRADLSPHGYAVACGRVEARVDRLLELHRPDADNERLANRMRKHRDALTVFLYNELVEPTDNLAERELRPAIIARKLSAGNRSERGAQAYAVLASVQRSMRRCGMDWLAAVVDRLRAWRPQGAAIWTPGPAP